MCGRYTLTKNLIELSDYLGFDPAGLEYGPHFNISPGQFAPVLLGDGGALRASLMRWGLVPFWAKDEQIAFKTINARSETLSERASFKHALKKRRCLVVADGFYEWQKVAGGKQPHYFYLKDNKPFAFAGLYEKWDRNEGPEPLYTYTVVTTTPNSMLAEVHNRMPVILDPERGQKWLDLSVEGDELAELFTPYPPELMQTHPVDKAVGNSRNSGPQLVEPI